MHLDVDLLIGVLLPNCFLSLSLLILTSSASASTRLLVVTALLPRPPPLGRVSGLDFFNDSSASAISDRCSCFCALPALELFYLELILTCLRLLTSLYKDMRQVREVMRKQLPWPAAKSGV